MAKVVLYSKDSCPYCVWAKQLLDSKNIAYSEIRVDLDTNQLETMIKISGRRTVPQIFINDKPIGGFDDLSALAKSGELDALLGETS
jgi:glutaredoxin 3